MESAQLLALLRLGVRGAGNFPRNFQWEAYKELRRRKLEMTKQSEQLEQPSRNLVNPLQHNELELANQAGEL